MVRSISDKYSTPSCLPEHSYRLLGRPNYSWFAVAYYATLRPALSVRLSVRPSIQSVRPSGSPHFTFFWFFAVYGLTEKLSSDHQYNLCACPPARDLGSRVYGLGSSFSWRLEIVGNPGEAIPQYFRDTQICHRWHAENDAGQCNENRRDGTNCARVTQQYCHKTEKITPFAQV